MRVLYGECADAIRATLADSEPDHPRREHIATFSRKAADILRAGDPAFSYEWFFGACGLDNWGDLMYQREAL
jgi:hypothetical protein